MYNIFDNNLDPLQILINIILGITLYHQPPTQVKKSGKYKQKKIIKIVEEIRPLPIRAQ